MVESRRLSLSEEERTELIHWFQELTAQTNSGPLIERQLPGQSAAKFLKQFGLPDNVLSQIWDRVAKGKSFLNYSAFCKAVIMWKGYDPNSTLDAPLKFRAQAIPEVPPPEMTQTESNDKVSIQTPKHIAQGYWSSYYLYPIATSLDGSYFHVNRRFSDLDWLHGKLTTLYQGYCIPPLPDKPIMGTGSPQFLEKRRRDMEQYLNYLLWTQVVCRSPVLEMWLTRQDQDFETGKASYDSGRIQITIPSAEEVYENAYTYLQTRISRLSKSSPPEISEVSANLDQSRKQIKRLLDAQASHSNILADSNEAWRALGLDPLQIDFSESNNATTEVWYMVEGLATAINTWKDMVNQQDQLMSLLKMNEGKGEAYQRKIDNLVSQIEASSEKIEEAQIRIIQQAEELEVKKERVWKHSIHSSIKAHISSL